MKKKKQKKELKHQRKDRFESGWMKLFSADSTFPNFKNKNFLLEIK